VDPAIRQSDHDLSNQADFASGGDYNADGVNFDFPKQAECLVADELQPGSYINGIASASVFGTPTAGTEGKFETSHIPKPGVHKH